MTEAAIRVDRVSKSYQIYERPQDRLKQSLVPRLRRFFTENPGNYYREFRALRDVSFEVRKGETLGIIGQNGSGKSTLLQIICGTLNPSSGTVETSGRVAALLELGSGFNPDFTGRENVYLYAAVLGLARSEVEARFDAIAAFADIGDFINQPVKTYSSGMVVRLAFAVIAHVDADILVIDEALAVGDVVFTQKCMRFLRTFMETGTVLFVSHDIGSVLNLCSTAAWLDHGVLRMCGNAKDVTDAYLLECAQKVAGDSVTLAPLKGQARNESDPAGSQDSPERLDADTRISFFANIAHSDGWTTSNAEIDSVELTDMKGNVVPSFCGDEKVCLTITAAVREKIESPIVGFLLKDRLGQPLFGENTFDYTDGERMVVERGMLEAKFVFNMPMLPNGDYSMTVSIAEGNLQDHVHHHWLHDAALIRVVSEKARYGLVGIPFESVTLSAIR